MSLPRPIALALAASAALALASCGGADTDEKNDYVAEVNKVTTTLNSGLAEVTREAPSVAAPDEAVKLFSTFGATVGTAATDISAITAPDDVADLQVRLVQSLETLRDEAKNAADEIEAGGAASVPGVATRFIAEANTISGDVDSTISEIDNKLHK